MAEHRSVHPRVRGGAEARVPVRIFVVLTLEVGGMLTSETMRHRHIVSARVYGNEVEVGQAVRDSGIPRGDIFVSKCQNITSRADSCTYESQHRRSYTQSTNMSAPSPPWMSR